jgi:hypothetical protein
VPAVEIVETGESSSRERVERERREMAGIEMN